MVTQPLGCEGEERGLSHVFAARPFHQVAVVMTPFETDPLRVSQRM